jgi:hypothetical protein
MESLAMTYFHTGIRTIIGAESFHGPVRDGIRWFHSSIDTKQTGKVGKFYGLPDLIWKNIK